MNSIIFLTEQGSKSALLILYIVLVENRIAMDPISPLTHVCAVGAPNEVKLRAVYISEAEIF